MKSTKKIFKKMMTGEYNGPDLIDYLEMMLLKHQHVGSVLCSQNFDLRGCVGNPPKDIVLSSGKSLAALGQFKAYPDSHGLLNQIEDHLLKMQKDGSIAASSRRRRVKHLGRDLIEECGVSLVILGRIRGTVVPELLEVDLRDGTGVELISESFDSCDVSRYEDECCQSVKSASQSETLESESQSVTLESATLESDSIECQCDCCSKCNYKNGIRCHGKCACDDCECYETSGSSSEDPVPVTDLL